MTKAALIGVLVVGLAACSKTYRNHGYAPSDDDLAQIIVGVDTRDSVAETIGDPGASGVVGDEAWYYVGSRFEHYAYRAPKPVERSVVAISFDDTGAVQNVERFGLEDGRVVQLSRRVTATNVKGPGFIRQLLGSFGNLNPAGILGGD